MWIIKSARSSPLDQEHRPSLRPSLPPTPDSFQPTDIRRHLRHQHRRPSTSRHDLPLASVPSNACCVPTTLRASFAVYYSYAPRHLYLPSSLTLSRIHSYITSLLMVFSFLVHAHERFLRHTSTPVAVCLFACCSFLVRAHHCSYRISPNLCPAAAVVVL